MFNQHVVNSIQHHDLVSDSTLHVVAVISNSARYHSRYRLFRDFEERMLDTKGIKLHVVELAFGDRHHEVTVSGQTNHLQVRSGQELWHKENMINLGVKHLLPVDWRYLAWVDADVTFRNHNWATETIQNLQHYPVIQPWSECVDLGPYGNILQLFRSFTSLVAKGVKQQAHKGEPYPYGHSGFAWACTRSFYENVGGLMDFPILGSADHHMAWAMINKVERSVHGKMTAAFKRRVDEWQDRAFQVTHGHLGYVPGRIEHSFHGPKAKRFYRERWQILVDAGFDPDKDLRRDAQGLLYIVGKPQLLEDIRQYMRSRNEDSIDE